jgi:DNA repair protein RecN (Recombination protein N)
MLRELRISNFAIIDQMTLAFGAGLNVLTGETGAGKSIVTRAIGLLRGERAGVDLIRTDAEEAEIQGLFETPQAAATLAACGLPAADEILVRRVIGRSGKGRVYVNGELASAGLLVRLGENLIHIYGQHEQSLLLNRDSHLDFLDEFGRLGAARERMAAAYASYREAHDRLDELTRGDDARRQRLELLRFQVDELRAAAVAPGEEKELSAERERRRHAEKLTVVYRQSEEALYSGDYAVAGALGRVAAQLRDAARIDSDLSGDVELLQQSIAQVEEVSISLRRAADRLEHDPERLEQIEERLALLSRLKRKYGCDADGLIDRLEEMDEELRRFDASDTDIESLRREVQTSEAAAWEVAHELTRKRREAARRLQTKLVDELAVLGMDGAVFQVAFAAPAGNGAAAVLTASGADALEFHLSANPGEAPKPLARIASGGELSRIMLALKALSAGAGAVATMIFDEVDAGIGGAIAEAVGKRLHALGRTRQVLSITHLAQIAALADHHLAVEKRVAKGRTVSSARLLDREQRVREVARMLGGGEMAESEKYARRLLDGARAAARR